VAEINALAEKMRFLGGSRYTVASLIKLLANPVNELVVKTDQGELRGKFSFMLACNTRYTGKGMMMAPRTELADGKFDVLSISRPQKKLVTNIDGEIKGTTPLHFTVHTNKIRAFVAPR
jgi:diacylglycerol kinase family enzyme